MRDGSVDLNVLEEYGQSLLAGLEDAKTEAELQKQAFLELCKATTLIEIGEPFLEYRELLSACLDLVPKQLTDKGYVSKVVAGTEVVAGIEGPRYLDPSKKYYWDKRVLESEDLTGGSIIIPPKYLDVLNEEKYRFPLGLDVVDTERYISIEHIPAIFFHEAGHGFYLYLRNNNPEDLYKLVVIKRRLSELAGDYQLDLANEGMSYEEAWNKIVLEGAPFLYSGINAEFHGCHVRVFSDGEGEDGTFLQGDEFVAEMFASYLLERERIVEFALTLPTEQRDLYTGNDGLISILDRLIERTQIMTKREAVRRHVDSLKETQRGVLLDCVNETEDRDLAKKYDQIYGEEARLAD